MVGRPVAVAAVAIVVAVAAELRRPAETGTQAVAGPLRGCKFRTISLLEPPSQRCLDNVHLIGRACQAELCARYHGVPALERDMVHHISRIQTQINIVTIAPWEAPAQRRI